MMRLIRLTQGKQFSRFGCAFTPACGSEVWALVRVLLAGLKSCPSGSCHGGVVAWCEQELDDGSWSHGFGALGLDARLIDTCSSVAGSY